MQIIFWITALFGTVFFLLKTLLSFTGLVSEEMDQSNVEPDALDHGSDNAFKIVSVHSLTGFLMMFGWVGLACLVQYQFSPLFSVFGALIAGLFMMIVTAYIFKFSALLASPGSTFDTEDLVGRSANVYQKIPADGSGKIHIAVDGTLREVNAVSDKKETIPSFTEVKVVKALNQSTVSVRRDPHISH